MPVEVGQTDKMHMNDTFGVDPDTVFYIDLSVSMMHKLYLETFQAV